MLEIQSFVASFTCVEFSFEINLRNFDPFPRISIEIRCALRCSQSIDIEKVDPAFTVSIFIIIYALSIEMVSESVVPLRITIIRKVVNAFVLKLEWELVFLAVP